MTSYPLAEVEQRTKECGPAWRAAFDACVVDREPNGKWVRVDRGRPEWQQVVRLGEGCKSKPPAKSRGLGDTIAKVTSALGIKPCGGCKKRQEALNKAFPYRSGS